MLNCVLLIKNESKAFYNLLEQDKEVIENEVDADLEWKENPNKTQSKIIISKNDEYSKQ